MLRCAQSPRSNVLVKYASARRFFARLASEIFLSSVQKKFSVTYSRRLISTRRSGEHMQHLRKMTAIHSVDNQALSSALDDCVLAGFRGRIFLCDPHQEMRVLDVHHDVLGIVNLFLHGYPKFALEFFPDTPRQRSSFDQLCRITDLQDGRGSDGLKPRTLRQMQPGIKTSNGAFEHRCIFERLCSKTQNRSFLYSQGNVIVFALALLA